jgi:hypothetical protein
MPDSIEAYLGFSKRDSDPVTPDEIAVPGYPDNRIVPVPCSICDARQAKGIALERQGFTLITHKTRFAKERERDHLRIVYNDEMATFIKSFMDASHVVPSRNGLLLRYGSLLVGRKPHTGPLDIIDDKIPASFAHVDYLSDTDTVLAQAAVEAEIDGQKGIHYSRMIIMQTWRALSPPPQDVPLAICDRRTIEEADISTRTGVLAPENSKGMPTPVFHVGGIHFNVHQRWYYYPHMRSDEVLLFTGFDTANPSYSKVAHAAFDNRAVHPNAEPRVSIEARFYVYYD